MVAWLARCASAGLVLALASGCGSALTGGSPATTATPSAQPVTARDVGGRLASAAQEAGAVRIAATYKSATKDGGGTVAQDYERTSGGERSNTDVAVGDQKLVLRVVGGSAYLFSPSATQGMYVKFNPRHVADKDLADTVSGVESLRPVAQLRHLGQESRSFRAAGDGGRIDGIATRRYLLTVDAKKFMAFEQIDRSDLGAKVPRTFTVDLRVGTDGVVRRISAHQAKMDMTIRFSRWGRAVPVSPPPADEVLTWTSHGAQKNAT